MIKCSTLIEHTDMKPSELNLMMEFCFASIAIYMKRIITILILLSIIFTYLFSGNRHLATHIRTLDWVERTCVEVVLWMRK